MGMQYHSPRFTGDPSVTYDQSKATRAALVKTINAETMRLAFVQFFEDLERYAAVATSSVHPNM
jgi:hypothetical protein